MVSEYLLCRVHKPEVKNLNKVKLLTNASNIYEYNDTIDLIGSSLSVIVAILQWYFVKNYLTF